MLFWSDHPFTALTPPHALTSLFGKLLDSTINNYDHSLSKTQLRWNPTLLSVSAHIQLKMLEEKHWTMLSGFVFWFMNLNCREASEVSRNLCFPSLITLELSRILHLLSPQTSNASSPSSLPVADLASHLAVRKPPPHPPPQAPASRRSHRLCRHSRKTLLHLCPWWHPHSPAHDVLPAIGSLFSCLSNFPLVSRSFSTALNHVLTCLKAVSWAQILFVYLSFVPLLAL